jgi:hypothetical protein
MATHQLWWPTARPSNASAAMTAFRLTPGLLVQQARVSFQHVVIITARRSMLSFVSHAVAQLRLAVAVQTGRPLQGIAEIATSSAELRCAAGQLHNTVVWCPMLL